jgi:Clostripain family
MDGGNRPVGREKRVGAGGGGVFRRGGGLGGTTGGPVGDSGGYADRTGGSRTPSGGGGPSGGGPLRGGGMPSIGCSPKILVPLVVIVAIIAVVVYLTSGSSNTPSATSLGSSGTTASGSQPGTFTNTSTYTDAGVYPVVTSVSPLARAKRTLLKGNGADTVTVMVYMCGTDLESDGGMATADLNEMLYAPISDKVNVIVETGGTSRWRNSVISSGTNQRYRATAKGLQLLLGDLGKRSMVDPGTLSDFIQYCKASYPADRYELVLWDHGGGSITGYGYDQLFPKDSMTVAEIGTALKNGGCTFDFVGFDACLMGALETATVLEPYADYMIASEETEPGVGWYYTGWMTALSQNTSVATTDLAKTIIDDYTREAAAKAAGSQTTLSLIDLAELKGTVPSAFAAFSTATTKLIDSNSYKTVSDARVGTKEFARSSQLNQIDLINFAEKIGSPEATALAAALRGCIKYNRTSTNITNANGISVFFPSGKLSQMNSVLNTYDQIGIASEYRECITSYASVTAGGQAVSAGSGNFLDVLLQGLSGGTQTTATSASPGAGGLGSLLQSILSSGNLSSITGLLGGSAGWLDTSRMQASVGYYEQNRFDASALAVTQKNGQKVIALPEQQWKLVQEIEQNVFVDDGKGFIDLGLDNVYDYNPDGDLIMTYDGTWLALNGHIVSYYLVSDDRQGDSYSIKGRIPAMLNGQLVDIIVMFDNQNPYGVVLGAQVKYDAATQTETVAKGLVDIVAGDKIDYLCDYYTYAGVYSDTYYLGDPYAATGEWKIENLSVGNGGYQMTYRLTDIYGNKYWTPSVRG